MNPRKGPRYLPQVKPINHLILEKGKVVDIPLPEAAKKLKAGDVVMKGANALDYKNKMAATNILDPARGNDRDHNALHRGTQGSPRHSGRP